MKSQLNIDPRARQILDAAHGIFVQYGYDKTTLRDIAAAAGLSRGLIYLEFKNKEALFETLLYEEVLQYGQVWLAQLEADPQGGTIGSIYRAVLYAINSRPFMAALMRRDRHIFGNYLRRPNNLFAALQGDTLWVDTLGVLQDAGMIRREVDPVILVRIMNMLAHGLVYAEDELTHTDEPPFTAVMETIADIMDRALTPSAGGDRVAARQVIQQMGELVDRRLAQMEHALETRSL